MSSIISDIGHAVSDVAHGVENVAGDIFSGVTKVFKSVTNSGFGRALLIGATIYLGGGAMGLWQTPFASVNGAFTSQAAAASGTVGAQETAAANAAQMGQAAQDTLGAAGGAGGAGSTVSAADQTAAALNTGAKAGTDWATGTTAGTMTSPGGMSVAVDPSLANTNEAAFQAGFNSVRGAAPDTLGDSLVKLGMIQAGAGALQGAFTPNAADLAKQSAELQRQNFAWQSQFLEPHFDLSSLNLGISPSGKPLTTTSGQPVYPAASGTMPARGPVNPADEAAFVAGFNQARGTPNFNALPRTIPLKA